MWNDEITLISYPDYEDNYHYHYDDEENAKEVTLLAQVRSATRYEYSIFGNLENIPEYIVTVNKCEYENQHICRFRNEYYSIERQYEIDNLYIELTLVRNVGE